MLPRFFVGRSRELDLLLEAAEAARAGMGSAFTIAGEPGIGKTRLADEASHRARTMGMLVAWGRTWEAGGAPAFWPWVQIARAFSRAGVDPPPEVSRILPEHGGAAPPLALGADRFALFDAVLRHITTAASRQPLFLVLDDLHAADAPSLALTEFLAPAIVELPVVLVAIYRDVEARLSEEAGDKLARLARSGRALKPPRLSRSAVDELAKAHAGQEGAGQLSPATLDDLYRVSEGNPLYVNELLHVMGTPVDGPGELGGGETGRGLRIPDSVRAAIRAHLARLPDELRGLLDAAAVIGREFTATALADLLEPTLELDVLVSRLAAAAAAGVIAEPSPMRFTFAHGLFREVLYADLGARRLTIHRRVAEALERMHADNPAAPLAEIARHWFDAGPMAAAKARDTARRAAERASAALAHEEAAALLERALQAHEHADPGNAAMRVDLLIALADAHARCADRDAGQRTSSAALALARQLGDASAFARAALARGAAISPGDVDSELVAVLEEARSWLMMEDERAAAKTGKNECCEIDACTPTAGLRARVLARLASARQPARDPRGPVALAREAIELLPDVCDEVRLSVLYAAMGAMVDISDPLERRPINEEAARLAAALGEREIHLRTLLRLFFDHADAGDLAGAAARLEEIDGLARAFPRPSARVQVALCRSMLALLRGNEAEHLARFAEARRLAEADPSFARILSIHQIGSDRMRGRIDELVAHRDEHLGNLAQWTNYGVAFEASLAAKQGDPERAKAALARLDRAHLPTCMDTFLLGWVAEGAAAAKDAEVGSIVEEALAAHAGEWISVSFPGFIIEGPVSGARALAAEATGRSEDAQRFRREALNAAQRAGADLIVAALRRADARSQPSRTAPRSSPVPADEPPAASFAREGEYWTVSGQGGVVHLKESRGLAMLARLVAEPGREIAAIDLEAPGGLAIVDVGDAGELIDDAATAAYRRRLVELEDQIAEAEAWNDAERLARAREESDALRAELSRAIGLGGKKRRAGGAAERARVNVQRRITDAIQRIEKHHAPLGRHLSLAVRTGMYLSYLPERARR